MAKKNNIRSKQHYGDALALEKAGDYIGAMKLYQKAIASDALNIPAWNRQMVLYRKLKTKEEEVKLIKSAIAGYQQALEVQQGEWFKANSAKANSTRALAQLLGLLEPNGLPVNKDPTLEKWQTRLYLLSYRLGNARKKNVSKKTTKDKRSETGKLPAGSTAKRVASKPKPMKKQVVAKSKSVKRRPS